MKLTTHIRNLIFLWRQRNKTEIKKPEYQPNGIIDELQYLQEENKETLQEAERL